MLKTFRLLEYSEWKRNIDSSHSKLEKGAIYVCVCVCVCVCVYMEIYSQN